tara:strand:+ start:165 stop:335 length:171 start_codon:yes stop_codon:yes gene_type:complete
MPKYTVHGSMWVSMDIEAEDESEAREIYSDKANDYEEVIAEAHTFAYRGIDSVEED